jgi:hypothetical protein
MRLLPEGPGADLAHEGLLPGVDLEVLLEVEPLGVDEEAAHRATLVVRPVRHSHRFNMELDLQCLFGLHVYSCTHWLRPSNSPSPRIWAHGRYWSAKIDDISL